MPRYFFDVRNDGATSGNSKGMEIPNLQIAAREAAIALSDMVSDVTTGLLHPEMSVEIRDEEAGWLHVVSRCRLFDCPAHVLNGLHPLMTFVPQLPPKFLFP